MKVLVTGAGGFLGGAVARQLVDRGDEVRGFSRGHYPALEALGVDARRGDLADADAVLDATDGCDAVIHVAGKPGIWGPRRDYVRANVTGTEHVLKACRAQGIRKLVYTSSPSVVHAADTEGADESLPYPKTYLAHYAATKAAAERRVLAAHGDSLWTVALRPHLIWGPGDNHLLPRMVARARPGRLALVGSGENLVDTTWVEDAARAHLLALDRLQADAPCGGRAYFITQGDPRPVRDILNGLLRAAGAPEVTRSIPAGVAYGVGALMEATYGLLRIRTEPPMTRFLALQLSTSHWYDISAARRDLGYEPQVTIDEAMGLLQAALAP